MESKLINIIYHFGSKHQAKKLIEEASEVQEAVIEYENVVFKDLHPKKLEHIKEELADVLVLVYQLIKYYEFDAREIKKIMEYKINRTLQRIENDRNINR